MNGEAWKTRGYLLGTLLFFTVQMDRGDLAGSAMAQSAQTQEPGAASCELGARAGGQDFAWVLLLWFLGKKRRSSRLRAESSSGQR